MICTIPLWFLQLSGGSFLGLCKDQTLGKLGLWVTSCSVMFFVFRCFHCHVDLNVGCGVCQCSQTVAQSHWVVQNKWQNWLRSTSLKADVISGIGNAQDCISSLWPSEHPWPLLFFRDWHGCNGLPSLPSPLSGRQSGRGFVWAFFWCSVRSARLSGLNLLVLLVKGTKLKACSLVWPLVVAL